MASVKRFFWLKLKEDFFKQKEIKLLRKIAGGDTHTIIYLKILLLSLKNNGKVYFEGVTDNFFEEIALEIDEDIENVAICMKFLEQKGLLIYDTEDSASLTAIPEMIGSESESARRMRKHRQNNVLQEKPSQCNAEPSQCDKNVTTEIDKDKELEKEREKEKEKENILSGKPDFVFPDWLSDKAIEEVKKGNPGNYEQRIPIAYLNQVTRKSYKFVDKNTRLVNARLKESYTLEDFKTVIDKKTDEWENNADMAKYLRPETLFGTKFDSYLNQSTPPRRVNGYLYDEDLPF